MLGGFGNASSAFPMQRMPAWRWGNTWLLYSELHGHRTVDVRRCDNALTDAFGLGIRRVGIALEGFAIILGITASVGSLLPVAVLPGQLWTRQGYALMVGLFLLISGVRLISMAGRLHERELPVQAEDAGRIGFGLGLVICLPAGNFCLCSTLASVFGKGCGNLASLLAPALR